MDVRDTDRLIIGFCCWMFAVKLFAAAPWQANPLRVDHPGLPFPSDFFSVPAPDSATGLRLKMPPQLFGSVMDVKLPMIVKPDRALDGSDGFSAASKILFELDYAADPATLRTDEDPTVMVFDLTTGQPVKGVTCEIDAMAHTPGRTYLEINAPTRWAFAHRYFALLTTDVRERNGKEHPPVPGLKRLLAGEDPQAAALFSDALALLTAGGIDPGRILTATVFTVRSQEEVRSPFAKVDAYLRDERPQIRVLHVRRFPFSSVAAVVNGEILLPEYRSSGGAVNYASPRVLAKKWVPFMLTLPRAASGRPLPVAIYSHGIGLVKETMLFQAFANARHGYASIATDHPCHGLRRFADEPFIFAITNLEKMPWLLSLGFQASAQHLGLYYALRDPQRSFESVLNAELGKGAEISFATDRIVYQALSFGGIEGSLFASVAPGLGGILFQETGLGVTHILQDSVAWDFVFSKIAPKEASPADVMVGMAIYQHLADYGDAVNFIDLLRGADGRPRLPVALLYGWEDSIVPRFASELMAELSGLPRIEEDELDPQKVRAMGGIFAVRLHPPWLLARSKRQSPQMAAHLSVFRPNAYRITGWWSDYLEQWRNKP